MWAWCPIVFVIAAAPAARAQQPAPPPAPGPSVTLKGDALLYGDNTEFRNPFREGETIFGAAPRVALAFTLGGRADVELGAAANHLFGGDDAFESVRPVVALTVRGRRSAFTFGTLPLPRIDPAAGPDHGGPHGLLPPLQRETLSFTRPYEAGMEWTFAGGRLRHDLWINWQRVNTAAHRERFDAGGLVELRLSPRVAIPLQLHVEHEGGQLFASGAVRDSAAAAGGVALKGPAWALDEASIEAFALVSRHVPDRSTPQRTRNGAGVFTRASAVRGGWRAHILFWRGDDFVKDEGDPNYQSVRRDGSRYRGIRDYAEAGVTRAFRPAPGVMVAVSARLHRVERHYEYSYRVLGVTRFSLRIR